MITECTHGAEHGPPRDTRRHPTVLKVRTMISPVILQKEEKTEPKDEKMAEADAAAEAAPEAAEPPVDAAPASTPEPMDSSS